MAQIIAADKEHDVTNQTDYTKYIRFAKVLKVYDASTLSESDLYGKVDLIWLDSGVKINGASDIVKPFYSVTYGCGIVTMPCVNDIAACYCVQDAPPIILGFFSKDQFDAALNADKLGFGSIGYIRAIKSGEVLIKSRSQSEIYLKNDGTINIQVRNGKNKATACVEDTTNNNEPVISRTSSSDTDTLLEFNLGINEFDIGNSSGAGKTVFSMVSGVHSKKTIFIDVDRRMTVFSLPVDSTNEVISVDKFVVLKKTVTGYSPVKEFTTGMVLNKQYVYLPESVGEYGATENPCSLDINNSFVSVKAPNMAAGLIEKGARISITYTVRIPSCKITSNSLGDLFVDSRNIVMRSGGASSYLGLFNDGSVKLGGSHLELGDKLRGHITVNRAGVELSAGALSTSAVATVDKDMNIAATGTFYYFIIKDDYPLFGYNASEKKYFVCGLDEYNSMSNYDKCHLNYRTLDPSDMAEGFTDELAAQLIKEHADAGNTIITYKELKSL